MLHKAEWTTLWITFLLMIRKRHDPKKSPASR
jgi:hypothetical protein